MEFLTVREGGPTAPGRERIMRHKLIGTLFAILSLTLWTVAAPAATLAGTVVAVSGSCD